MTGLYRNKCSSLYCIEVARCCEVQSSISTQCGESIWENQMKRPGVWTQIPENRFLTGLYREGLSGTIHDLSKVSHCNFKQA
jgi:hypothetical protein